jgi:hypothetical protein
MYHFNQLTPEQIEGIRKHEAERKRLVDLVKATFVPKKKRKWKQ